MFLLLGAQLLDGATNQGSLSCVAEQESLVAPLSKKKSLCEKKACGCCCTKKRNTKMQTNTVFMMKSIKALTSPCFSNRQHTYFVSHAFKLHRKIVIVRDFDSSSLIPTLRLRQTSTIPLLFNFTPTTRLELLVVHVFGYAKME